MTQKADVAIIGAGPSGSVAATMLSKAGLKVTILEGQNFPRFSIGESLLPYCMNTLERCGLIQAVVEAGFQFKNGAAFECGDMHREVDFREKFEEGWGTTYQVQRARFDQVLARHAEKAGATILYERHVEEVDIGADRSVVDYSDSDGKRHTLEARFTLDASGFGRVLPRLLDLERPSDFPVRHAIFTHVKDHIADAKFDRNKILITVHPTERSIWYWLIPFSDGTSSVGVVLPDGHFSTDQDHEAQLWSRLRETRLGEILARAEGVRPVGQISGYSKNVTTLHGPGFALLGNAAEFLDPVFSSGVTIAIKSAELASNLVIRQLQGDAVDWQREYAAPLQSGVDTFRAYVEAWYDTRLQDIIFNHPEEDQALKRMMVSVLAGYAWNQENPLVRKTDRYLSMLHQLCA